MPADLELEQRLRRVGEAYPGAVPPTPELERRIMARIAITPGEVAPRPALRRDVALAAAFILFVGTIALGVNYIRAGQQPAHEGPVPASPSPTTAVRTTPLPQVPAADLAAAQMTNLAGLVTPFNASATDSGRTITIIGAYADPARIVLFVHVEPRGGWPGFQINDDHGFINASSSGRRGGAPNDSVYILDGGPQPGTDGLAHLAISVRDIMDLSPSKALRGNWSFAIALKVQPSIPVAAPKQFQLGRWKGNVEIFEVTPTVVHLQAVINGATVEQIGVNTVTLVNAAGTVIGQGCSASITVPKTAITSPNSPLYHNSRVYCGFARPSTQGTYRIQFQGGGGVFVLPLTIDALPPSP